MSEQQRFVDLERRNKEKVEEWNKLEQQYKDKSTKDFQSPNNKEISPLKVMKTAAGYYIGREQLDVARQAWEPLRRVSDYLKTQDHANKVLNQSNKFLNHIKDFNTPQLKYMYNNFSRNDGESRLKGNLIDDKLQSEGKIQKSLEKPKIVPQGIER